MGRNKIKKKNQIQVQNVPKPLDISTPEKVEEAVSNVGATTNEIDFNSKKSELMEALQKQVQNAQDALQQANADKEAAEAAKKEAEEEKELLKKDNQGLESEKTRLTGEKNKIQSEYNAAMAKINGAEQEAADIKKAAEEEAENIKETAKKEAEKIKDEANTSKLKTVADARMEAANAWEDECNRLKEEFNRLGNERVELERERQKFNTDKSNWEIEKEAFDDEKNYVEQLKEKYQKYNPQTIDNLNFELQQKDKRYEALKSQYDHLQNMFAQNQAFVDSLKISLKDTNGKETELKEILPEINEMLSRYRSLQEVYKNYPDIQAIENLEKRAEKADTLELQKIELQQQRDDYKEKAAAAVRTSRELETVRREVEATNALNQHLIQELESHKTALENRTGDVCPALRKVDDESNAESYKNKIEHITRLRELQDLPSLVAHIKNYAGCTGGNKERLFYKDNDIRAFLAGMAVSRLIILQGMSGTGKSSLPRAVAESISGFNKLIPVESSWRDRNELLGYYNDFNKKFNAKTFTIELYRSGKDICSKIPTFIVLDEMNLARIEYYFSDFLAVLQKPNSDDWIIDLVASDMRTLPMSLSKEIKDKIKIEDKDAYDIWLRIEKSRAGDVSASVSDEEKQKISTILEKEHCLIGAEDLIDGRKIRVPKNVWFVGTANKDESTFEISDKVYDRAQVIVLNDRGEPEDKYEPTTKQFISVDKLQSLFTDAKDKLSNSDEKEIENRLKKLEDVLKEYFGVAFGNRIYNQAKDFTAVFMGAGGSLVNALDYQISTKIWRKIETCDKERAAYEELQEIVKDYQETSKMLKKKIEELS